MDSKGRWRIHWTLALTGALVGCEVGDLTRYGGHPEVASVRLFGADDQELTPEVRLPVGVAIPVQVRFYDAAGRPMTDLEGHSMELIWEPLRALVVDSVAGDPMARLVTLVDPCAGPEQVRVGYGHGSRTDERVFGPFPVAARYPVRSVRLFDGAGNELTPAVRLPYARPFRVEARFYDCREQPVTAIEDGYGMQIFWTSGDFAHVDLVQGEPFQRDVVVLQPPGTSATLSLGFGPGPYPIAQVFGPWPLTISP